MLTPENKPTSRGKLLEIIESFLKKNPHITDTQLGWKCVKDGKTVGRLRAGGDITTSKMDSILEFITTYKG